MHVVASKVESNQALEDDSPSRESGREEDDKTSCSAAIGNHVENSTEASRLLVDTRGVAIKGIEKA